MSHRFLIFGPSWLGDAIMAIPTYRDLRRAYPGSHLAVLARSKVADLYQAVPEVDEVVVYRRPPRFGFSHFSAYTDLVRRLQAVRADTAIILPRSFGSAWTALLSNASRRIGYGAACRTFLLSDPVERSRMLLETHRVHYMQHLLTPLGIEPAPEAPRLTLQQPVRERAAELLEPLRGGDSHALIAFNPGASYGSAKQWPEERFAQLAAHLLGESQNTIVLVGGPKDHAVCDRITHGVGQGRLLDLSGRTTVPELAAVLEKCALLVSNDTGAMHVAAAVGTPIVAIFGPTDPVTTPPYGEDHMLLREPVECSPCLLRECPIDHRCMERITVQRVRIACEEVLQRVSSAVRTS